MASTAIPATSSELLARVAHGYRSLRWAIDASPRERAHDALASGWPLAAVVAHLAAWDRICVTRIASLRAGGERRFAQAETDRINADAAARARDAGIAELLAEWDAAHERVVGAIAGLSDAERADARYLHAVEADTFGHYPDHFADVAPRSAAELVAQVQRGWSELLPVAWSIGASHLDETSPDGRTYKAVLAHVAAWERATARRLAALRETGERPGPPADADTYNARITERAAATDADVVLRELRAAHEDLVAEVSRLVPEQLPAHDGFAAAIVSGNTFGHYAEHFDDLMAGVPRTRDDLLARMRAGWRPFRRGVGRIGWRHLADRTAAGWTLKAMLAHVAFWMEEVVPEIAVRMRGERSAPKDVDAVNARVASEGERRTAADAIARLDAAYAAVREAVSALPDEVPFFAVRAVAGETYDHFREHGPEVEAAQLRTADDVVARLEEAWVDLRAAVRGIGRARLDEELRPGWRYADAVAHVIGWIQQAVRELRAREYGRGWTTETIDAFNARSVNDRRLVGPEALLDELDTSYRMLLEAVRTLGPAELADASGPTIFYTWHHWEDHLPELAR